jgi:hypothetical protein
MKKLQHGIYAHAAGQNLDMKTVQWRVQRDDEVDGSMQVALGLKKKRGLRIGILNVSSIMYRRRFGKLVLMVCQGAIMVIELKKLRKIEYYAELEKLLWQSFERVSGCLSTEERTEVETFIDHAEYGLAHESLALMLNEKCVAFPDPLLAAGKMMNLATGSYE